MCCSAGCRESLLAVDREIWTIGIIICGKYFCDRERCSEHRVLRPVVGGLIHPSTEKEDDCHIMSTHQSLNSLLAVTLKIRHPCLARMARPLFLTLKSEHGSSLRHIRSRSQASTTNMFKVRLGDVNLAFREQDEQLELVNKMYQSSIEAFTYHFLRPHQLRITRKLCAGSLSVYVHTIISISITKKHFSASSSPRSLFSAHQWRMPPSTGLVDLEHAGR